MTGTFSRLLASDVEERLEQCSTVLEELLNVPDGIPRKLLDKAEDESETAQDFSSQPFCSTGFPVKNRSVSPIDAAPRFRI